MRRSFRILANVKDFIIRCYKFLKGSALCIYHLPKAVVMAISRWISSAGRAISDVGQAIKAVILVILRGIAIGTITILSLMLLCITLWALVKVFRIYQHKKQLRIQLELLAERQRKEAERLARAIEDAKMRQARAEETRRRQEELRRQKEAQERRQQEERKWQKARESQRRAENDHKAYRQWLGQCEVLLSSREAMTRFPDPPFWPCSEGCQAHGILKACQHTIKRLFQEPGSPLEELLEKERRKWHPDKFERCPDSSREHLKAKAERDV
jgi:hypothetical protein